MRLFYQCNDVSKILTTPSNGMMDNHCKVIHRSNHMYELKHFSIVGQRRNR